MGADLIGYMYIGPAEISEERQQQALGYLNELSQEIKKAIDTQTVPEQLKELAQNKVCDTDDTEEVLDYLENCISLDDPQSTLDDILTVWHNGARDVVSRFIDKERRVVFAGDMSWGDSPQGFGYQILDLVSDTGLDGILGLE